MDCQCLIIGPDVRPSIIASWTRIEEPEGLLTHPRFGARRAVCESISSSGPRRRHRRHQFPALQRNGPARSAARAIRASRRTASTQGTEQRPQQARTAWRCRQARGRGHQTAPRASWWQRCRRGRQVGNPAGRGCQLVFAGHRGRPRRLRRPKAARTAAMLALTYAENAIPLRRVARRSFAAGSRHREAWVRSASPLYGSRGRDEKLTILRLNRIARPFA